MTRAKHNCKTDAKLHEKCPRCHQIIEARHRLTPVRKPDTLGDQIEEAQDASPQSEHQAG